MSKNRKFPARRHLNVIHPNSGGIDVGSREMWVAIPANRGDESVRKYGVFTEDLAEIAKWFLENNITTVAMESTGVYWIPLYDILSTAGIEVCLVNPRELKSVPGRKSDLKDCQWLQELHAFGLLRASFRPGDDNCAIRSLMRQRQEMITSAARQLQLMQKALTQMNVRLTEVVTDIGGKTGMSIIRAILKGRRSPDELAKLRDPRCKQDIETFIKALTGTWRQEHLLSLKQSLALYDSCRENAKEVEEVLISMVDDKPEKCNSKEDEDHHKGDMPPKVKKKRGLKSEFQVPIADSWKRVTGVDLTAIDGVNESTASVVLAEVGLDIDKFSSSSRFSSWLGLTPRNDVTGGKVIRRGTKSCANRVATALRLAAQAAGRTQTEVGSFFRRISSRAGKAVAITATARKLSVMIWNMLTHGQEYHRRSAEAAEKRFKQRQIDLLVKRAKNMGLAVTPLKS